MSGEIWQLMADHDEVYRAESLEEVQEFIEMKTGDSDDQGGGGFGF